MSHDQTEGVVAIRRWQFEDLDAVCAIERQAGDNAIDRGTLSMWIMTTYLMRGYALTEDGIIRGFTVLFLTRDSHADIQTIRIDASHRDRGFGKRLLAHLVEELPELDKSGQKRWRSLWADIDSRNASAVRLFERLFVKNRVRLYLDHVGKLTGTRYEMEYPVPPNFHKTTITTSWEMSPPRK